jgi:hypothetical protein
MNFVCLFLTGLNNDPVSNRTIYYLMERCLLSNEAEGCGKKPSWPNLSAVSPFTWKSRKKKPLG